MIRKKLLIILGILSVHVSFAQKDNLKDSSIYNMASKKYEITYSVSSGNVFSYRILPEGILLQRINLNGNVNLVEFIPLKKLDYSTYLQIQYCIDTSQFHYIFTKNKIPNYGFPSSLRIIHKENVVFYVDFQSHKLPKWIKKLFILMNDLIPKKYKKKFKITGFDLSN